MASNKMRGEVIIDLDHPRVMRFDLNAMAVLEQELGVTIAKMDFTKFGMIEIRASLFAMLSGEDPELTIQRVGSMVGLHNMKEVQKKIEQALSAAMDDQPKAKVGNVQRAGGNGTGTQQESSPLVRSASNPVSSGA